MILQLLLGCPAATSPEVDPTDMLETPSDSDTGRTLPSWHSAAAHSATFAHSGTTFAHSGASVPWSCEVTRWPPVEARVSSNLPCLEDRECFAGEVCGQEACRLSCPGTACPSTESCEDLGVSSGCVDPTPTVMPRGPHNGLSAFTTVVELARPPWILVAGDQELFVLSGTSPYQVSTLPLGYDHLPVGPEAIAANLPGSLWAQAATWYGGRLYVLTREGPWSAASDGAGSLEPWRPEAPLPEVIPDPPSFFAVDGWLLVLASQIVGDDHPHLFAAALGADGEVGPWADATLDAMVDPNATVAGDLLVVVQAGGVLSTAPITGLPTPTFTPTATSGGSALGADGDVHSLCDGVVVVGMEGGSSTFLLPFDGQGDLEDTWRFGSRPEGNAALGPSAAVGSRLFVANDRTLFTAVRTPAP